jgi:regulator of sigma E protease
MLTNLVAFFFVIGVLVFVHELGHFLAARRIGVRVLTFSLGFGPKIAKFRRGDTEYCISAIPLGGYVKMAGDNPDDQRTGADDEFMSKSKFERFQVLIMGPVMNMALAIIVMTFVLYQGAEMPAYEEDPPVVSTIVEGSAAEGAGIQVGDRIVSVEGQATDTWSDVFVSVMPRAGRVISIVVGKPGGEQRTISVIPDSQTKFEMGDLGIGPIMEPQIRSVSPAEPAARAGLQAEDVIVAVGGDAVTSDELITRINASPGQPLDLTIRRGDAVREMKVVPALVGDVGLIGVSISPFVVRIIEPGFFEAFTLSLERNYEWSGLIFQSLIGLFTAETSPRQLVGPVGIAQLSGGAFAVGPVALFSLLAMISLNLGILNLFPVPVLDGGHIVILALEGVARRDFSALAKERVGVVGFVMLLSLMGVVIYNDLARIAWIERFMPWR